ncbi:MAG TPA: LCCL domain-containing protein [Methylomirabilota bacterium]|nr:LCCL domain-containing protein [Methylomirabilota bacterium]
MTSPRRYVLLPILSLVLLSACGTAAEPTPSPSPVADATTPAVDPWRATAAGRGEPGQQITYDCPPGGAPHTVWGSEVYTDDSSVCTAGVHAGLITLEEGGSVTIEIRPGQDSYEASERNGIETYAYGAWGGSYVMVDD